jgi:hypothetical protein
LKAGSEEAISSDTESEFDEHSVAVGDNSNVSGSQDKIWSRPQHLFYSGGVHPFIGIEDTRGFTCEQGLFTDNCLFYIPHGYDLTMDAHDFLT